jgi:uncharacterized protein YkwD
MTRVKAVLLVVGLGLVVVIAVIVGLLTIGTGGSGGDDQAAAPTSPSASAAPTQRPSASPTPKPSPTATQTPRPPSNPPGGRPPSAPPANGTPNPPKADPPAPPVTPPDNSGNTPPVLAGPDTTPAPDPTKTSTPEPTKTATPEPTKTPTPTPQPTATPGGLMGFLVQAPENGNRHDWPLPRGYMMSESLGLDDHTANQTWDFGILGTFEPLKGDGFQIAELGADGWVRFTSTRDGGTPYVQHFVGQRCGGTGWIVFGSDVRSGEWNDTVAMLNIAQDPATCPTSLNAAYTRYRLEPVVFPFAIDGAREERTVVSIISEHYNGRTIGTSVALERSYLGHDYGLIRWEAWGAEPPKVDLSQRCSPVAWSVAPVDGWYLQDCRTYTNVVTPTKTPEPTQTATPEPTQTTTPEPTKTTTPEPPALKCNKDVLVCVNIARAANGLPPLVANATLDAAAQTCAVRLAETRQFVHSGPTPGFPYWGENIAYGFPGASAVVDAWLDSPGHRKNILNPAFTQMGIGYVPAGNFWCQQFGGFW